MTDKWVSMNDKVDKNRKKKMLKPYQVNKKIMTQALNRIHSQKSIINWCLNNQGFGIGLSL